MDTNPKRKISFGIDSATLRLPIEKDFELGDYLSSKFLLVCENTGECEPIRDAAHKKEEDRGISTYYRVKKNQQLRGRKTTCDIVELTLIAKQLQSKYMDGIRPDNCKIAYDYIMSQGYFKCGYDHFLSGDLVDVDFKADFPFDNHYTQSITPLDAESDINSLIQVDTEPALKEVKRNIDAFIKRTKTDISAKGKPFFSKNQGMDNYGVEWYSRKRGAFAGKISTKKQNTRVYAKGLEMYSKSNEFRTNFLADNTDLRSILRLETNGIKNSHSARSNYGITDTSLRNVLSFTLDDCRMMFTTPFSHFLESDYKASKPRENNPFLIQVAMSMQAEFLANPSRSFDEIFDRLETRMNNTGRPFENKQRRYYYKKAMREAYDNEYGSGVTSDEQAELSDAIKAFINFSF